MTRVVIPKPHMQRTRQQRGFCRAAEAYYV